MKKISLLALNIGNPSLERAEKQCRWLSRRTEDVFVLSETKNSEGCSYIKDFFSHGTCDLLAGSDGPDYSINYPVSNGKELGVMIISKLPIKRNISPLSSSDAFFGRYAESIIGFGLEDMTLLGLYVPSRDRSGPKIERKKAFIQFVESQIKSFNGTNSIIMGDFNILDRNHFPHYNTFFDWEYGYYDFLIANGFVDVFRHCHPSSNEYSWVGRTGDGYRYDYAFISKDLQKRVSSCQFIHETRKNGLTDHSAVSMLLDF